METTNIFYYNLRFFFWGGGGCSFSVIYQTLDPIGLKKKRKRAGGGVGIVLLTYVNSIVAFSKWGHLLRPGVVTPTRKFLKR